VLTAVCPLVVTCGYAYGQPEPDERVSAQRWYRSTTSSADRVARLAVITRSGDRIAPFAYVRRTPRTVRIKLIVRSPVGAGSASARLQCVRVRLDFPTTGRLLVDASTGRAPDLAPPGSPDASERSETFSVNLRGSCTKLRPRYLRDWGRRR
jgi:hypothetical protein